MKNRKAILLIIGVILCGLLVFGIVSLIQRNTSRARLLQAVRLENAAGLKETGYTNWTDWLKYKDGYEIMAFSADKEKWKTSAEWTREQTPISLDELQNALGVHLDDQGINRLNITAGKCSSWYFLDHRSAETPFKQREYYLAFTLEDDEALTIVIYRAHDLYGMDYK